jgi:hypothetical protein
MGVVKLIKGHKFSRWLVASVPSNALLGLGFLLDFFGQGRIASARDQRNPIGQGADAIRP